MPIELGPIPHCPPRHCDEAIYDNTVHVLDDGVAERLLHDQQMFAVHTAKSYQGFIYCYVDGDGVVRWCEEIWLGRKMDTRYRGTELDDLIARVIEDYGDA